MSDGIGDRFQKETRYARPRSSPLARPERPASSGPATPLAQTKLDPPAKEGGISLWRVLETRRSVRSFSGAPLSLAHLSQLLWAAQGVTKRIRGHEFRTAPSAGALYPVETYLAVHDVEGLKPGIYHYDVQNHALELVKTGDVRGLLAEAAAGQTFTAAANVVVIWTAVFERSKRKYRDRAYRYIYLDAGHIAQNVALASVALGLGSCQIAAFFDDEANALIGVGGDAESVIYMTAVGTPAPEEGE